MMCLPSFYLGINFFVFPFPETLLYLQSAKHSSLFTYLPTLVEDLLSTRSYT